HHQLRAAAPLLNRIMLEDTSFVCHAAAIRAAGQLIAIECLPTLLKVAARKDWRDEASLTWTLKNYATEECRPHLRRVFEERPEDRLGVPKAVPPAIGRDARGFPILTARGNMAEYGRSIARSSNRVVAAWGLAKLGDKEALAYLVAMLHSGESL